MIYKILKILTIILVISFSNQSAFTHDYYLGKLTIDHPYIINSMPGSKMVAGYLKIINKGYSSDYLVGAESLFSDKIEIHEMSMTNGIMKMRKLPNGLEIPDGKEVILQAEEKDYKRGLLVELLDNGGYRIKYWYGDDVKVYPAEVEVDGESIKKDAKVVDILFHPELK